MRQARPLTDSWNSHLCGPVEAPAAGWCVLSTNPGRGRYGCNAGEAIENRPKGSTFDSLVTTFSALQLGRMQSCKLIRGPFSGGAGLELCGPRLVVAPVARLDLGQATAVRRMGGPDPCIGRIPRRAPGPQLITRATSGEPCVEQPLEWIGFVAWTRHRALPPTGPQTRSSQWRRTDLIARVARGDTRASQATSTFGLWHGRDFRLTLHDGRCGPRRPSPRSGAGPLRTGPAPPCSGFGP
jgi:hypothetical protein